MASRLLAAQDGLIVYDVRPEAVQPLVEKGARPAASIGELARQASLICLMVRVDLPLAQLALDRFGPGLGFPHPQEHQ